MSTRPTPSGEEQAFLARYDASRFPHPSVSVDLLLITAERGRLCCLVHERSGHPFRGASALPGGFVSLDESLEDAVDRVLLEKAGLRGVFTEQLFTFGAVARDPRTRVIAVAYYALVDAATLMAAVEAHEGRRLATLEVPWEGLAGGAVRAFDADGSALSLAFDHAEMLGVAVTRLRGKLDYAPIGFELLPAEFTLRQLQDVHETVLGHAVNKDSFRRRMTTSGMVEATGRRERDVLHRPAALYRFARPKTT
ncbi:MAG: NUDIX domain-containing protein [Planctomycetota bacterium]